MMPPSIEMAMLASRVSVMAALWLLGGLKAGTPLLIASIPVNAAQPDENARANSATMAKPTNGSYMAEPTTSSDLVGASRLSPKPKMRMSPQPVMPSTAIMKP